MPQTGFALCAIGAILWLVGAFMACKLHNDIAAVASAAWAAVSALLRVAAGADRAAQLVVGGFVAGFVSLYMMFVGAELRAKARAAQAQARLETGEARADDTTTKPYNTDILRTHRKWYTRTQLIQSVAAVIALKFILAPPLQKMKDESSLKWENATTDTLAVTAFVLAYFNSHDDY